MKVFITEIDVAVARTGRTQELWARVFLDLKLLPANRANLKGLNPKRHPPRRRAVEKGRQKIAPVALRGNKTSFTGEPFPA